MINVSINTSITSEINLFNELHLVKSILPYADKIKLYSPKAYMILTLLSFAGLSEQEKTEFLLNLIPSTQSGYTEGDLRRLMEVVNRLKKQKHKKPNEIITLKKFEHKIKEAMQEYETELENIVSQSGFSELIPLVEQELIEFQPYELTGVDIGNEIMRHLENILSNHSEYPLFDEDTNSLVNSAINEGIFKIENPIINKSQHIELVSNFMDRIPSLDKLPIDEILDIRKELQSSLIRFRAAIQEFSEQIEAMPWKNGFKHEADSIYLKSIEPALLEIEEKIKANNYLQKLLLKSMNKSTAISFAPLLGIGIASKSDLLSIAFASMAPIGTLSANAIKSYFEWKEKKTEIVSNKIFFLYKLKNIVS